ncbi:AAA family ATPase [Thermosulfurimonas dismutans]|nr:AAA family ATPase [Thermosulfurimonas dismutans]
MRKCHCTKQKLMKLKEELLAKHLYGLKEELLEELEKGCFKGDDEVVERAKSLVASLDEFRLFYPQLQHPILENLSDKKVFELFEHMKRELPLREEVVKRILVQFLLKFLMGSRCARAPFLVGPPGTGKSQAVEALRYALDRIGVSASVIRVVCTSGKLPEEQMDMKLFGTEVHYSNAHPSEILKLVAQKKHRVVIVFLDEVDKAGVEIVPILVKLLDPAQPLEDNFVSGMFPGRRHDMRYKVFVMLAGNRTGEFEGLPELCDRVEFIEFPPYSSEEKVKVLLNLSYRHLSNVLKRYSAETVRKVARKVLAAHKSLEVTFRYLVNRVEVELLERRYRFLRVGGKKVQRPADRTRIGFCVF